MASRLNHLAGSGEIIISKSVYELTKDLVSVESLAPQSIKGKSEKAEVFRILGRKEDQKAS